MQHALPASSSPMWGLPSVLIVQMIKIQLQVLHVPVPTEAHVLIETESELAASNMFVIELCLSLNSNQS